MWKHLWDSKLTLLFIAALVLDRFFYHFDQTFDKEHLPYTVAIIVIVAAITYLRYRKNTTRR